MNFAAFLHVSSELVYRDDPRLLDDRDNDQVKFREIENAIECVPEKMRQYLVTQSDEYGEKGDVGTVEDMRHLLQDIYGIELDKTQERDMVALWDRESTRQVNQAAS